MLHKLRPYQLVQHNAVFDYFASGARGNPLIAAPTGCHAKGQMLLMYDGTLKAVEAVIVGDRLMGPNSLPRTVLQLCRGRQAMREIVPVKGKSFVVNSDHILSLYRTPEKSHQDYSFVNETVANYERSSKWYKHVHKLWRTGVNFPNNLQLPVDPYFLGVFLGDGGYSHTNLTITSPEAVILNYCVDYWKYLGNTFTYQQGKGCWTIIASKGVYDNRTKPVIRQLIDSIGLEHCVAANKHVPQIYKTSSYQDRLAVIAGLIDTDGHLTCGCYDFISKSQQLAEDLTFLARSVGLAAYIAPCQKYCQLGTGGTYYRVSISGNTHIVPCKVLHKKAAIREQSKNVLVTGFKVNVLPEDNYYGFTLSGDGLYLLDDFTVTHNTGKAFTVAALCYTMLTQWPHVRGLMCTHVKELVDQNAQELWGAWSQAPLGIFSSGLKRREFNLPLIFGGVASVARNLDLFGWRDFMIVDEAHLVSPKSTTMYQKIINHFKKLNPNFVVIGLSATIFRLGQGLLTEPVEKGNPIFTDVVCDHTTRECYARFVNEGYMSPLISKRTSVQLDISGVKTSSYGDLVQNQLELAVDKEAITRAALMEAMEYGHDRKAWLIFASGIDHAEHIATMLNTFGITAAAVHSDKTRLSDTGRDNIIKAFKAGKLRALVNYKMLTTGFNHPAIDLIIDLYPTISPGMHVQKYGRGTRPFTCGHYTKENCLVLDYSGNTRRLGPIDDPVIPNPKSGTKGTAPIKTCDHCSTYNHISATNCMWCGTPFTFKVKITETASDAAVMSSSQPEVHTYEVSRIVHNLHTKEHTPDMIKITYLCPQGGSFSEFLCPEHNGFAQHKAHEWWRQRHNSEPPKTTREWLNQLSQLRIPARIRVWVNKRYPEILSYEF